MLDTRVYRSTYLQSDHKLVVSTIRFKIKTMRHHNACVSRKKTIGLPRSVQPSYKEVLNTAFSDGVHNLDVEECWNAFKGAFESANELLPEIPCIHRADWVTDELLNLSRKKCDAWLQLSNNPSNSSLKDKYQRLKN